jgi:hypothetical protein
MRTRVAACAAAIAAALLRAPAALACAVCFGGESSDWNGAFLLGTVLLLLLPPAIVVGAGVAIYRATKRQEARLAEREQASAKTRAGRERTLRPV